jgi:hypothetical protein
MQDLLGTGTETRTNHQLIDAAGTISWPGGSLDVTFNLIELQDSINGVPGRTYSYGNLRFSDRLESSAALLFLSSTRLVLTGGGVETSICLYGINSFTVMGILTKTGSAEPAARKQPVHDHAPLSKPAHKRVAAA